jgi:parvulin-like peptidyl-prolyl isomerase
MLMPNKPKAPSYILSARSLTALATILLVIVAADAGWPADSVEPAVPVAQVNGVTIYESDLSCAIEASLARNLSTRRRDRENPGSAGGQIDSKKTLRRLIDIELLYQESLKHRFHGLVEESEKRYQLEVKRLGGEDRLESTLQCNNMSSEQFRKAIFRNLSIKRLLDKMVYSRIQVTEHEIREYYEINRDSFRKPEAVRIRQILIKVSSAPGEDKWQHAEQRAHTIFRDASTGTDFVRLARRHSDDPVSASTGGDMGSIQKGNLQGVFDTIIFNLRAGAVTKPIRSHQGFHIIKIVSTTPSTRKPFEEVKQQITTRIRQERARIMISRLVSELKVGAEIKIIKSRGQEPGG